MSLVLQVPAHVVISAMARAMAGTEQLSCVPSDLLHHVYTFLVQFNFHKSAKALQKATDEVGKWYHA